MTDYNELPQPNLSLPASQAVDLVFGLVAALNLIARKGCENFVEPYNCWEDSPTRTANAKFTADRACSACVAQKALAGEPMILGPGVHADE